jgi:uncharacterized protein YbjT (DUF2867 family)
VRVVVLGATGATGRHVVTAALTRDLRVVALARRPEALSDLANDNLETRRADVHDPDTVTVAGGCSRRASPAPTSPRPWSPRSSTRRTPD